MKNIKNELLAVLKNLINEKGLPVAAGGGHYDFCWIRDTYYILRVFRKSEPELYKKGYDSLCEYYLNLNTKYNNKVDWLIKNGQKGWNKIECIHPRFDANTLNEVDSEWGNSQIDALAYLLLGISEGWKAGIKIEGSEKVVDNVIEVLKSIEYWNCKDSGIWEENEEVRASSIGSVVSALDHLDIYGTSDLIDKGCVALDELLPRESKTREHDLALSTLIGFPFNVCPHEESETIVNNIHANLEGEYGAIRYKGDAYYNNGVEMQWTLWLGYAGIYYFNQGKYTVAKKYLEKLINLHCTNGHKGIPEGYVSGKPNPNNPLGWACALTVELIELFE